MEVHTAKRLGCAPACDCGSISGRYEGQVSSIVIVMRIRVLAAIALFILVILPVWAQDAIDSESGPVEVEPDTEENVVSVPVDENTGTVAWEEYLSLPNGGGAQFGFVTVLYPPDPSTLEGCPDILLDGAWYPPIPFSFGFYPSSESNISVAGWWYLEDASGTLARRDINLTIGSDTWGCSTWFMGSTWIYHVEQGWNSGYIGEQYYAPDDWSGPGIDYFLRSVWFRGILGGERMSELLERCGAERLGRDMMSGGRERLAIFKVPPNETDRQNGRGSLLVWVRSGTWDLVRTRLHAAYAVEVTEFRNVSREVAVDPDVFYSDYLTDDIYWSINEYLLTHDTSYLLMPMQQAPGQPETIYYYGTAGDGSSEDAAQDDSGSSETETEGESGEAESGESSGTDEG